MSSLLDNWVCDVDCICTFIIKKQLTTMKTKDKFADLNEHNSDAKSRATSRHPELAA